MSATFDRGKFAEIARQLSYPQHPNFREVLIGQLLRLLDNQQLDDNNVFVEVSAKRKQLADVFQRDMRQLQQTNTRLELENAELTDKVAQLLRQVRTPDPAPQSNPIIAAPVKPVVIVPPKPTLVVVPPVPLVAPKPANPDAQSTIDFLNQTIGSERAEPDLNLFGMTYKHATLPSLVPMPYRNKRDKTVRLHHTIVKACFDAMNDYGYDNLYLASVILSVPVDKLKDKQFDNLRLYISSHWRRPDMARITNWASWLLKAGYLQHILRSA